MQDERPAGAIPKHLLRAGRPRLRQNLILFEADRVRVASFRMPNSIERKLERKINPVADFARLSLPARITSIEIADDHLIARGMLVLQRDEPPSLPAARS